MDLRTTGCYLLALVMFVALSHFTNADDIPMDIDESMGKIIEENFMKHISEDLKAKLQKNADEGGDLDFDNLDSAGLTDDEKKQLENALKEALTPMFGEFVQMLAKSGLPGEMKKYMGEEKSIDGKGDKEKNTKNESPEKENCTENDSKNKCEAKDDKTQEEPKEEL